MRKLNAFIFALMSIIMPSAWGANTAVAIAGGEFHTCAVTTEGGVKCWGRNLNGQLGDGTATLRTAPVDVSGLTSGVKAITAGGSHTCALTVTGGVKCWGRNYDGELGNGTSTDSRTPVDVSGLTSGVTAIAAGYEHTCAVTTAGGVKCWGNNYNGQLTGTIYGSNIPIEAAGLTNGITGIVAGSGYACAVSTEGAVKCWGKNGKGQLGDQSSIDRNAPVNVYGLTSGITAMTAGTDHACALTQTGGLKCWGSSVISSVVPVDVEGYLSGVTAVAAGNSHSCLLTAAGGVKCWGYSQLGSRTAETTTPIDVPGLTSGVKTIAAGTWHTCAITSADSLKCWGRNDYGELGSGVIYGDETPVEVLGLNGSGSGSATYQLTVSNSGSGSGTIISNPSGINCGSTCSASFSSSSSVTLSANAASGSTFASWSGACGGAGSCVVTMSAAQSVTANFSLNAAVPERPTIGTSTPGNSSASIAFTAPANNGGSIITSYTAICAASGQTTRSGSNSGSPITVSGLTNGVEYSCWVTATNSSGTSANSGTVSVTPHNSNNDVLSLTINPGWNLVGNSSETPIAVATVFNDAAKVASIWKWVTAGTASGVSYPNWAFYSPAQSDGGQAYAKSKGYDVLITINGGEGYWLNANDSFTAQLPSGSAVASSSFQSMGSGWHLISTGTTETPSSFNANLSASPPSAGVVPLNIKSLWVWDNLPSKWYFYAPGLEATGGATLVDYTSSRGYLDFTTTGKTLGPGVGFWVNKP